jgi:hypothetical protein
MQDHLHTGFISFLFAGISAVVFMQAARLMSAKLVDNPKTASAGKALGALVTFSGKE